MVVVSQVATANNPESALQQLQGKQYVGSAASKQIAQVAAVLCDPSWGARQRRAAAARPLDRTINMRSPRLGECNI